jgi:hypothetical protein
LRNPVRWLYEETYFLQLFGSLFFILGTFLFLLYYLLLNPIIAFSYIAIAIGVLGYLNWRDRFLRDYTKYYSKGGWLFRPKIREELIEEFKQIKAEREAAKFKKA